MHTDQPLSRKRIRVGILGAGFDTGNLGVGALTYGAMKCVLAQYPDSELFLLEYGKVSTTDSVCIQGKEVVLPKVNMRFSWKVLLPNNIVFLLAVAVILKLIPFRMVRTWIVSCSNCLRNISDAEFLAALSGGDSFSDIYGLGRLLYVSLPQILVLLMGKRLILLPQTFGPFKAGVSRVIARAIIRRADHIYSRDRAGLQLLAAMLGPLESYKASFCYDVGFVLDPALPQQYSCQDLFPPVSRSGAAVGINVSGLLSMGGYDHANMFGLRLEYSAMIEQLIDFLIMKRNASVILIPHVMCAEPNSEGDNFACVRVYEKMSKLYGDRVTWASGTYNQSEIKYIIGQCDFFVGSRMHACIAAVSQHVPAISVAYSDKFIGVMETIGVAGLVADARRLTAGDVITRVAEAFDRREILRKQLVEKMPSVKGTVLGVLSEVVHRAKASDVPSGSESSHTPVLSI